jgi:flagellar L-ring protein precursor FlgH
LINKTILILSVLLTSHAIAQTSLINTENYQALTSDRRAVNIGDILTVLVAESTSAKSSVGTNAKNKTNLSFSASTLTAKADAGLGVEGGASGEGNTSRQGQLKTVVSVQVKEKLPNGYLKVEGSQEAIINNDKQLIQITGLIRPDDISYDNTVYSYRLADAKIQINGKGVADDSQKLSIFYKLFHWLRII